MVSFGIHWGHMKKLAVLFFFVPTLLIADRLSVAFTEPLNQQDRAKIQKVINLSKKNATGRVGIVLKRLSFLVQGDRGTLHTIAKHLPYELLSVPGLAHKLACVVHLDTNIITDKEAEKLVWDLKDETDTVWKMYRGSKLYAAFDVPKFDPHDVFDAHGNFTKEALGHFYSLTLSESDRKKTFELIHSLGTKEWYSLLWNKSHMEKIGDEVDKIHPVRFAGYIFANPELKSCMRSIREFSLKWNRFKNGFSGKMESNYSRRNVLPYLPGFCIETGADYEEVLRLVHARKWEGLLDYLIYR